MATNCDSSHPLSVHDVGQNLKRHVIKSRAIYVPRRLQLEWHCLSIRARIVCRPERTSHEKYWLVLALAVMVSVLLVREIAKNEGLNDPITT